MHLRLVTWSLPSWALGQAQSAGRLVLCLKEQQLTMHLRVASAACCWCVWVDACTNLTSTQCNKSET